jgi:hypothetical protein
MSGVVRALRTLAVGAAATGLVLAVTASPADAKTRTFTDKRGDAAPAFDITKVKVTNKKRVVIVRATVPGLKKSQLGVVSVALKTRAKGRPIYMLSKARIENAGWMPLMFMDPRSDDLIVRCKGDKVTFGKRSITVRIPQRCLGDNRKALKAFVGLGGRDFMTSEEEPKPGPDAQVDGYPSLSGNKLSPWVRYR